MRTFRELTFRIRQQAANALLAFSSPNLNLAADTPLALLPNPAHVADALRDTEFAHELIKIADEIVQGRVPIFDKVIDYGPAIAWRRDPQHGVETPANYFGRVPYLDLTAAGDHKLIWEINRHQHLVLLAQACVVTGRDVYYETIFRQLEHWWAENPFQCGINWTSALEVGVRASSWIWIWHLVGAKMATAFRQRFLAELYRHGLHLEYNLSIYFSPNTHLLGEAVALHALGRLFPEFPRADRWRSLGARIVRGHIQARVRNDGSYFEQSTYYQVYALDMFAFHAVLDEVPASYRETLTTMAEFLAGVTTDSGDLPFLGDDDGGRFFSPYGPRNRFARATLAAASVLARKRFFHFTPSDVDEIALWWLGPDRCKTVLANSSGPKSRLSEDTGIVVFRRGPVVALFDAGSFGQGSGGHSHSDTLSLVITVGDKEVLIDSGTFSYMDPQWRSLFRGSTAHNTICIDGHDQGVSAGPFRWSQKPEVKLVEFTNDTNCGRAAATCSYSGFTHTRTVEFTNSEFAIIDHIAGPQGEHDIEQFWHFAHMPREVSPGAWAVGDIAEFTADGGCVEQGWRSRCFDSKEPAPVIVVRRRATLPLTLHARLRLKV